MTDLLPPAELSLEAAGAALAQRFRVRNGVGHATARTFYDTFDGRLRAAGLTLAHENGHLELRARDSDAVHARAETPPPDPPLFAAALPPGALREALVAVAEVRALLPVASLSGRERPLAVLDAENKTVVRLALGSAPGLPVRVRVIGVRGYDAERAEVVAGLVDELGFRVAEEPLIDQAVRAAGGVPGGVSSRVEVPLAFNQRADTAAAAVLKRLLEVIEANLNGAIAGTDTEFLHDLRVAVRRTRSVQRELRRVFPPVALERFRRDFRWLQQVTGSARDLDVYDLEFESFQAFVPASMQDDLEPLRAVLRERRGVAHRRMVRALRSRRAVSLRSEWSAFLGELGTGDSYLEDAARPIGELAAQRIRAVYRRMRRMGEAIGDSTPAADYHDLRKQGKELRYLLELFGTPLFPPEVVKPMIKTLKALQDVLGRHQDREIQCTMLDSLIPAVAEQPRTLMAMGALIQRLREDELAARAGFAERFADFGAKSQRTLVREAFR